MKCHLLLVSLVQLLWLWKIHFIAKMLCPKLKKGQPVLGQLRKDGGKEGKGKIAGKNKAEGKKGDGSESQNQDWQFHELRPSDIQGKPTD